MRKNGVYQAHNVGSLCFKHAIFMTLQQVLSYANKIWKK
jgi:hypothetical protein